MAFWTGPGSNLPMGNTFSLIYTCWLTTALTKGRRTPKTESRWVFKALTKAFSSNIPVGMRRSLRKGTVSAAPWSAVRNTSTLSFPNFSSK